jgi:hypothetical protein
MDRVTVEVLKKGDAYRIVVGDGSKTRPAEKSYRIDDATGRGLQLLECLTAAWGCRRTGPGKIVWFDLPVPFDGSPSGDAERKSYNDPLPERDADYPS